MDNRYTTKFFDVEEPSIVAINSHPYQKKNPHVSVWKFYFLCHFVGNSFSRTYFRSDWTILKNPDSDRPDGEYTEWYTWVGGFPYCRSEVDQIQASSSETFLLDKKISLFTLETLCVTAFIAKKNFGISIFSTDVVVHIPYVSGGRHSIRWFLQKNNIDNYCQCEALQYQRFRSVLYATSRQNLDDRNCRYRKSRTVLYVIRSCLHFFSCVLGDLAPNPGRNLYPTGTATPFQVLTGEFWATLAVFHSETPNSDDETNAAQQAYLVCLQGIDGFRPWNFVFSL